MMNCISLKQLPLCCPPASQPFVSVTPHRWRLSLLWDVKERSDLSHTLRSLLWKRSAVHTGVDARQREPHSLENTNKTRQTRVVRREGGQQQRVIKEKFTSSKNYMRRNTVTHLYT